MATYFLSKKALLAAYKILSNLTPDHKQGATQNTSAIRYFIALDEFYQKFGRKCDCTDVEDKGAFGTFVGNVVHIEGDYYTSNFYHPLAKSNGDFNCGSNFFSVNVVKISQENEDKVYEFPRRGSYPLMEVQNGCLIRKLDLYSNFPQYVNSVAKRAALSIWLLRGKEIPSNNYKGVREALLNSYSNQLVDALMDGDWEEEAVLLDFVSEKEPISSRDIRDIFASEQQNSKIMSSKYRIYVTAIKTKPFLLLAGISGTGKSRIVRELARACWPKDSEEYSAKKPSNYEMVQVKPNWHDSTELIGYVSRIGKDPIFVVGTFLRFIAKAWEQVDVPYFLCLDEMNLAPVEQYFAEYLSVIETRKQTDQGTIATDPILRKDKEDWYRTLTSELTDNDAVRKQFLDEGIALPPNLIVVGTVNMDESTFSFSRKVLDRAMTIEMNDVDLRSGLESRYEDIGTLAADDLIGQTVDGCDIYADNREVCDKVLDYLEAVNRVLDRTPFKIAYRTRNEMMGYVVNNLPYADDQPQDAMIGKALDEATSMKILSRIEGDDTKVSHDLLNQLTDTIKSKLAELMGDDVELPNVSASKLREMDSRLVSGYTSYWS